MDQTRSNLPHVPASTALNPAVFWLDHIPDALPPCLPFKRNIRRPDLREIVPLGDTTIYEMEQRGEFPRRFCLTPRCVVWDLDEVEAWVRARRRASETGSLLRTPGPDVRQRKSRPVRP